MERDIDLVMERRIVCLIVSNSMVVIVEWAYVTKKVLLLTH